MNRKIKILENMIRTEVRRQIIEGKKVFKLNPPIGRAKYSISSHDGVKTHRDGSDFWDIEIFKNKVDLAKAIKKYKNDGFIEESANSRFSTNLSRLRIEQSDSNDDDYESQYWSAPDKIRNMIDAVSMRIERGGKDSYKALSDLNRVLNRHGWEIEYGLDGEIHTLRKI
jgi:hypothetical protein